MKNVFYFILKSFFWSQDIQIFVFLFSSIFPPFKINLKVDDVSNCLNKNLKTCIVLYLQKERESDIEGQLIQY